MSFRNGCLGSENERPDLHAVWSRRCGAIRFGRCVAYAISYIGRSRRASARDGIAPAKTRAAMGDRGGCSQSYPSEGQPLLHHRRQAILGKEIKNPKIESGGRRDPTTVSRPLPGARIKLCDGRPVPSARFA